MAKVIAGKVPYHLIPPHSLEEVALGFGDGATKYEPWDWIEGGDPELLISAAIRHLQEVRKGIAIDPETGLQHANKAAVSCMMVGELLRLEQGGMPVRAVKTKDAVHTTFERAEQLLEEVANVSGHKTSDAS